MSDNIPNQNDTAENNHLCSNEKESVEVLLVTPDIYSKKKGKIGNKKVKRNISKNDNDVIVEHVMGAITKINDANESLKRPVKEISIQCNRTKINKKPLKIRKCSICNYVAPSAAELRHHIRSHTGEKPHKCHYCDFTCSRRGNMKSHMLSVHCSEKRYKCSSCDYSTHRACDMSRHMTASHLGQKPYGCDLCSFSSGRLDALKRHVMAVHKRERPHKCYICEFRSAQSGDLRKHLSTVHGILLESKRSNSTDLSISNINEQLCS